MDGQELKSSIAQSHVKYLEAAGALVIPICYRLDKNELKEALSRVHGLYISGETPELLNDEQYMKSLKLAMHFAETFNGEPGNHFPVLFTGYGYTAVMQAYSNPGGKPALQATPKEQTTAHYVRTDYNPSETFLFDEHTREEVQLIFTSHKVVHEGHLAISEEDFMNQRVLSASFVPVGIARAKKERFVVMVEGTTYPFLGVANRPDKVLYTFDHPDSDLVDHSSDARTHAQRIAHFIVDQARLSPHKTLKDVKSKQVSNYKRQRLGEARRHFFVL